VKRSRTSSAQVGGSVPLHGSGGLMLTRPYRVANCPEFGSGRACQLRWPWHGAGAVDHLGVCSGLRVRRTARFRERG
jgi:hypothetical protein